MQNVRFCSQNYALQKWGSIIIQCGKSRLPVRVGKQIPRNTGWLYPSPRKKMEKWKLLSIILMDSPFLKTAIVRLRLVVNVANAVSANVVNASAVSANAANHAVVDVVNVVSVAQKSVAVVRMCLHWAQMHPNRVHIKKRVGLTAYPLYLE